ncbi:MAG: secondary thiamine-phosphate synthase enzyme YjbQ [Halovenus sp.]
MSIEVTTSERVELVDVTSEVTAAVPDGTESGVCLAFVPHTTAGVIVTEAETRLLSDIETILDQLVPRGETYAHDEIDDNADAHLRATLLGESVSVPIVDDDLALGTWQSILFVECDGPRTRRLRVTTIPGRSPDGTGRTDGS